MFWIALAAQLSAPEPKEIWFDGTDFWAQAIAQQSLSAVRLRITVTPGAKVQACEIEQTSGDPEFDARVCGVTLKRARFRAASLEDGTPAYGVFRVPLVWTAIPPSWYHRRLPEFEPKGDLNLLVDSLPRGKSSPFPVDVVFEVDANSHLSKCRGETAKQDPMLTSLACEQMSSHFAAVPAKGPDGGPVPSVQNGRVIFNKRPRN